MLLGAGAAVLVLAGVRATAWLIGPAFLALIVVIALYPVQAWLRRHNWPDWLTTLVLVLLVVGVLASFVAGRRRVARPAGRAPAAVRRPGR